MAEPDQNQTANSSSSSSSSSNRESSDAASSSSYSPPPPVPEVEDVHVVHVLHEYGNPELEEQPIVVTYSGNIAAFDDRSSVIRDDTWSCAIVVLTFWFFVSMTMILGVYGSVKFQLGPNCSFLIQPNPLFVEYLRVEGLDNLKPGPILYGFYKSPPLDDVTTWSENHSVSVPAGSHKEWIYFLNEGSQIDISYNVHPSGSSIFLIIAQGNESLEQWREDPTYPNTTLSWNIIHGHGMIQQNILRPSSYFVALGNLNSEEVEVQLNLRVKAFLYNTTEAYYKCTFINGLCSLNVLFPEGSTAVLTSPGSEQGTGSDEWYVRLSYGPRWLTYIVGTGGMTALMLLAFNFLNKFRCTHEVETRVQFGTVGSERAPLLSYKDDDLSSWGSSNDSASLDEEDLEDILVMNSLEGKPVKDGENSNNTRRLCAICYDAPRDCFFLPCGHCVSCFACGTRIAEAAGTCPICRRNMKKVRKIFTV